ncbi:MAG: cysteine synthase CysM [Bacteroidota bacterium]
MAQITDLVGRTPLAELQHLNPNPKVRVLLKLEGLNPGGSVKDRPARNMILEALNRGEIVAGDTLIEATSGNTGIALAYLSRAAGLKMKLVMPETATPERVKIMRAYGAEVILVSSDRGIEAARDYAEEQSRKHGHLILDQFGNHDNWKAHYKTTGPEIWQETEGKITHFVSAMGTTGTIMGVSKYLKAQRSEIEIVGVQPKEGSRIPGIRKWSEDYLPAIFDRRRVDRIREVNAEEAKSTARALANQEGIFCGISSGGAATIALRLAAEIEEGTIVSIACDGGGRYLSSDLFQFNP